MILDMRLNVLVVPQFLVSKLAEGFATGLLDTLLFVLGT